MATFMDFRVASLALGRRAVTITVSGELDLFTCTELQEELSLVPTRVTRALIDISRVTFIDSTGLALLGRFAKQLQARGGGAVLVVAGPSIRNLLRDAQLDALFELRAVDEDPARYLVGLSLLDALAKDRAARS